MIRTAENHDAKRALYGNKCVSYFGGVRRDWLTELGINRNRRILEVGCGSGGTGSEALGKEVCGRFSGIEIDEASAARASAGLTEVICADVENMELPWPDASFDVLFLSEVLEHLVEPERCLKRLHRILKPNALIFASSPNVAHYRVLTMLARGRWELADVGPMDRTHLRWFTPRSFRELFEACGFTVTEVKPHCPLGWRARVANTASAGRLKHLLMRQIDLRAIRRD